VHGEHFRGNHLYERSAGQQFGWSAKEDIVSEERLKIAVFVDFDNIEIGVKKTLSRHFDIGTVLEAIKERGEVVTKIAYGDWKHAADYSRAMTQHAVHMVQRNLTPGGDKNGADITLALDALEMAFTRSHINAFVIVGGDSDFIALVEKLKQYDKMVFVVGGRSFTSTILQKNCHEFIAYENLIGLQPVARKTSGRTPAVSPLRLRDAMPQLRRALEVLADREVSPQLGLLKSTLLQLDSTFSERDYGAHSFREFVQMMANAGNVRLKQVDRSLIVELQESDGEPAIPASPEALEGEAEPAQSARGESAAAPRAQARAQAKEPQGAAPLQAGEAVLAMRQILEQTAAKAHWPMYLRTFKHLLRSGDPSFDERRFGISNIHDLARLAQREGLLRIERNRQGILRLFPVEQTPQASQTAPAAEEAAPVESIRAEFYEPVPDGLIQSADAAAETPIEDFPHGIPAGEPVQETLFAETEPVPEAAAGEKPKRKSAGRGAGAPRQKRGPQRKTVRPQKKTSPAS
jgi:uncharacterized LabA/DUF88 family protein